MAAAVAAPMAAAPAVVLDSNAVAAMLLFPTIVLLYHSVENKIENSIFKKWIF